MLGELMNEKCHERNKNCFLCMSYYMLFTTAQRLVRHRKNLFKKISIGNLYPIRAYFRKIMMLFRCLVLGFISLSVYKVKTV